MLEGRKGSVLVSIGIALAFAILVVYGALMLFPYPEYAYGDYWNYLTQEECEAAGYIWLEDEYGGYCGASEGLDTEYLGIVSARDALYGGLIVLISAVAILASLFYIKNKTVANGFFGGSVIILFSNVFLTNALLVFVSMAAILAALIFVALKRLPKK